MCGLVDCFLVGFLWLVKLYILAKPNCNNYQQIQMSDPYCVNCHQFFGNPQNMNMCSKCYKQHKQVTNIKEEATNIKVPEIIEQVPPKQQDHSRCFTCNKKTGLLGFRCKGCECSYCNGHRLPQDHKCEGNFMQMAKNMIKKNNPNITAPKIEKI